MDTLHAPTPAPARDKAVNGGHAHVITSLSSPLLPPKVAHVAPPAHVAHPPPTHMASPHLRHRTLVANPPPLVAHQHPAHQHPPHQHPPPPHQHPPPPHQHPPPPHQHPHPSPHQHPPPHQHQPPHQHPPPHRLPPTPTESPIPTHKDPPPAAHSSPALGQRSGSSGESEGGGSETSAPPKDAPINGRASGTPREEDSSDTDMEIKSLDLTARVSLRQRQGPEKERPMSWEGELSDADVTNNAKQEPVEEQMRVDAEEPMSPMSPMSQGSDHDHEKPGVRQVKLEESGEEQTVYSSQPASHTDSPVPPRSDSGCEVLPGPYTPSQSPLLPRLHPHTHSPTHLYSPTQSPGPSRHVSGFSSPYSHTPSTGLSRNNSDASQYGGSYNSYSSAPSPISPTHYSPSQSPIQQRHINFPMPTHQSPNLGRQYTGAAPGALYSAPLDLRESHNPNAIGHPDSKDVKDDERPATDLQQHSVLAAQSGITRQQLINSPCPICGDKISGFHYGIFSCESCKGFFKRTVQNKKNYVCMRGSTCTVSTSTRKKCPACRFDKCLCMGMKLEAIREDRTRGGRSTYQCSPYPLPPSLVTPNTTSGHQLDPQRLPDATAVKAEPSDGEEIKPSPSDDKRPIPLLLQQIHDVEHLWHCSESEMEQLRQSEEAARHAMENNSPDFLNNLCNIADHRLYKIVKWCKSLPLFRHITIDDQICLLINSWCELLLLSCCFRSMDSPGEIRVSSGRTMTLQQAESMGIGPCIERMLNLTYQLSRLQVDKYEYMAMKVIVLLSSDVSGLQEGEKVRDSQKKVVQALQEYTLTHYPHLPPKFGELLLRIPELQRTCQASKEMLSMKKKEGDVPSFNFLFELLRGDH